MSHARDSIRSRASSSCNSSSASRAMLFAPCLVLVTHHVEEIMPGFSHVLILKGGRVLASGPKDRVMTAAHLAEAFGAPLRLTQSDGRYSLIVSGNASKVV